MSARLEFYLGAATTSIIIFLPPLMETADIWHGWVFWLLYLYIPLGGILALHAMWRDDRGRLTREEKGGK
jgi:hypothetical protein